jgi:hypothetical protein
MRRVLILPMANLCPTHKLASQRLPPKGIDGKKKHCKVEMYEAQKV